MLRRRCVPMGCGVASLWSAREELGADDCVEYQLDDRVERDGGGVDDEVPRAALPPRPAGAAMGIEPLNGRDSRPAPTAPTTWITLTTRTKTAASGFARPLRAG